LPLAWRPKDDTKFLCALLIVALLGGAFAVFFREALHALTAFLYGPKNIIVAFEGLSWWWRLSLPIVGGVLAGFIGALAAKRAGGHGVAEIMEAVALGQGQPSTRVALLKCLGAFVAMLTGGSIGREGPIVQFGSGLGAAWGRYCQIDAARTRTLIAAGTAAAFAAAYNTPIAAVLFVVEIVVGVVALPLLLPVIAAAALSTLLSRFVHGDKPLFGERLFVIESAGDLVGCLLVGAIAALFGVGFMRLLSLGEHVAKRFTMPRPVRGALGGLGVGLIAMLLPAVVGNGAEAVRRLLDSRVELSLLLLLLIAKPLATVFTVSGGIPGGVFTPSLFVGAAMGGIFGALAKMLLPGVFMADAGAYAMVGMAGVLAATTHAPLMSAVMLVELSGDYRLLLPMFLSATLALTISRRLESESIYTEELNRRGIPWRQGEYRWGGAR
jgi:CIC family chloride channel protein